MRPMLSLSIADQQHQPTKLHRFRYLKEVKDGRMGSVLHSRASTKSNVTVTVTAESVGTDCKLKLVGCTVFEDLMTHPFYLAGDDCRNGVFEKEFSFAASSSKFEVMLEKIGIVCTPKKQNRGKGQAKGVNENGKAAAKRALPGSGQEDSFYSERIEKYNFFHKKARSNPVQGKDVNRLRLAFQVFFQLPGSTEWTAADCKPVCTEVIGDAKIYSTMTVEYIIPDSVSRPDQDVWLYMKDPLPVLSVSELKVLLENDKQQLTFELQPKELKKHLVVFDFTSLQMSNISGTFSVTVVDRKSGDSSEAVQLKLHNLSSGEASEPGSKVARRERPIEQPMEGSADALNELLNTFTEYEFDDVLSQVTSEGAGDSGPELQELYDAEPQSGATAGAVKHSVAKVPAC